MDPGPTPSNTISAFTSAVLTPDGPRHKSFVSLTARLKSYKTWKHEDIQQSKGLAKAGFFHTGMDDTVVCFYCGVCLNKWEKFDNPWIDHAIHSPSCAFLLLNKSNWREAFPEVRILFTCRFYHLNIYIYQFHILDL